MRLLERISEIFVLQMLQQNRQNLARLEKEKIFFAKKSSSLPLIRTY